MTPREAVCQYNGWDFAEAADYRYHGSRITSPAVYSMSQGVCFALQTGKTPPPKIAKYFEAQPVEATGTTAEWLKSQGQTIWLVG